VRDVGIGVAAVLALGFLALALSTARIEGGSMDPTLRSGEAVLVDRFLVRLDPPGRGDVVLVQSPDGLTAVKRVIALPGDTIEIDAGPAGRRPQVLLKPGGTGPWRRLFEPYVEPGWTGRYFCCDGQGRDAGLAPAPFTVPPDQYFLLGDSRDVSVDSRTYGTFPRDRIAGRVVARCWPLGAVGGVR
jgi:signal peptidase I